MTEARPPPISTPAFTELGTMSMTLEPMPVMPNTRKMIPTSICRAIRAWVRSGPMA